MNVHNILEELREMKFAAVRDQEFWTAAMVREIMHTISEANDTPKEQAIAKMLGVFRVLDKSAKMIGQLIGTPRGSWDWHPANEPPEMIHEACDTDVAPGLTLSDTILLWHPIDGASPGVCRLARSGYVYEWYDPDSGNFKPTHWCYIQKPKAGN